jgi:hypothetical protein
LPTTETISGDQLKQKNPIDKVRSISWLPDKLKGGKLKYPFTFMHLPHPKRMKKMSVSYAHATLLKITFILIITVNSFSVS